MPESRTMTVRQAVTLNNAIPALDGHIEETTVENTKTGEKTTTRKVIPFTFGKDGKGGKIRWNIAKNRVILQAEADTFTKARDKALTEISDGTGTIQPDNVEAITKLNQAVESLLDNDIGVTGLLTIDLADLNLDDNPKLLPTSLAPLMPLIKE